MPVTLHYVPTEAADLAACRGIAAEIASQVGAFLGRLGACPSGPAP